MVLAAGLLTFAGCKASVKVGADEVSEAAVEEQASLQLAKQVGHTPPDIDCPGPLKAEKGATIECVLSVRSEPTRYPVTITVTSIDKGTENANFDIKVGEKPLP